MDGDRAIALFKVNEIAGEAFDVSIEALAFKTQTTKFPSSVIAHGPLGHTPPAFLFLSSTMSNSRRVLKPSTFYSRRALVARCPFGAGPAVLRQLDQETSEGVGARSARLQ